MKTRRRKYQMNLYEGISKGQNSYPIPNTTNPKPLPSPVFRLPSSVSRLPSRILLLFTILTILPFRTAYSQDPVQQAISELMDVVNADDILAEVNSFKALTNTNLYMQFELEDDSTYFPYVFNLYFDVRVERVEPYIIFKAHLTPIGDSYLTKEYKVTFTIEPSPVLQDKADQLNAIAQQINDLLKDGFRVADAANFKNTVKDAIKKIGETLGGAMDVLAELPGIIKEVLEEMKDIKINKKEKAIKDADSLNLSLNSSLDSLNNEEVAIPVGNGTGEVGGSVVMELGEQRELTDEELETLKEDETVGPIISMIDLYSQTMGLILKYEQQLEMIYNFLTEDGINQLIDQIKKDKNDLLQMIIDNGLKGESLDTIKAELTEYLEEVIDQILTEG